MFIKRLGAFFLDVLEVIVFAVAIFLFLYLLVLQPHKIKGASMEPNFPDGEYLLTDKVKYRFGEPSRGDVVVFKAPTGEGEEFIKRIIGLPGERIAVRNGRVLLNGQELNEDYIPEISPTYGGNFLQENETFTIPEGNYFVLGDNRPHSSDSRSWGTITKDKITGRAWLIYWPPKNAGLVKKSPYNL